MSLVSLMPPAVAAPGNAFLYAVVCWKGLGSIAEPCGKIGVATRPRKYSTKATTFFRAEEFDEGLACVLERALIGYLGRTDYAIYAESFRLSGLTDVLEEFDAVVKMGRVRDERLVELALSA